MSRHRAFTLVELLVVVTIIAMLAAIASGALHYARIAGREAATRSTIAKINAILMQQWEDFPSRRLPLSGPDFAALSSQWARSPHAPEDPTPRDVMLKARRNARRDLWRLEMPDRWSDTMGPTLFIPPNQVALRKHYRATYAAAQTRLGRLDEDGDGMPDLSAEEIYARINKWEQAETLYLVVMTHGGREIKWGRRETSDLDEDGLKEFCDAWGLPLMWLRWPAGFPGEPESPGSSAKALEGLGPMPLVLSAGPDGLYDINRGVMAGGATYAYRIDDCGDLDPWTLDENDPQSMIGTPLDATGPQGEPTNGYLDHLDNITNRDPLK